MNKFIVIAGPCVIENEFLTLELAKYLKEITFNLDVDLYFKASFDKANRSSIESFRGVGIDHGLDILNNVKSKLGLRTLTDVHETCQVAKVASICDVIQIPAFLCRQTDLILESAKTGKILNIKKGQFMAPSEMKSVVSKASIYTNKIWLCERGTFFGYNRLVNDFGGIVEMLGFGYPVVFDCSHSVQQPASNGKSTGGNRRLIQPLGIAATSIGVNGLFFETHPKPSKSPSDGENMIPLSEVPKFLDKIVKIKKYIEAL